MITINEIRAVAATVWDQNYRAEDQSETDMAFLDALARADRSWASTVIEAKRWYPDDKPALQALRNLADRQLEAEYRAAYRTLEAAEEAEIMGYAEAAE